jgi:hypothetical protein
LHEFGLMRISSLDALHKAIEIDVFYHLLLTSP